MESDDHYDAMQESKTAFVIAVLVAVYCFSVIIRSQAVHMEWKVICASIGFLVVALIAARLLFRLIRLEKQSKEVLDDSN